MHNFFLIAFTFLLLIFSNSLFSQKDNEVAEKLNKSLSSNLNNRNLDSAYINANKLIHFSVKNKLPYYEGKGNLSIGGYFFLTNNIDSSIYHYKKAEQIFSKNNNEILQGKALVRTAIAYRVQKKKDSALFYYYNALELLTINSDTKWYALIKDHLGMMYLEQGDYLNALKSTQDAVIAYEKAGAISNLGHEYNNLGIVYKETNNQQKAEEAYLKAINVLSKTKEEPSLGMAYTNLASIYVDKGEFKLALSILEKAKLNFEKTNYFVGLAGYYSVMSAYYNSIEPPEYYKVIESSSKGLAVAKKYNDYRQYAHATNVLGIAYLKTNKIKNAEEVLNLGLAISEKYELNSISAKITKLLSEVYEKQNQPKQALLYLQKHIVYNDSLLDEEKIKEITSLDLKFKLKQQKISDSIVRVQETQEINYLHEREIYDQKQSKLIFILIATIVFLVAVFMFFNLRKNKKQAVILSTKNSQIEKSLYEKEILLKEVHHRVKNNFQTISSLLELQSYEIMDKKAIESINESQNRIQSMSLIHQMLYQNEDISVVDFKVYLKQLTTQITALFSHIKVKTIVSVHNILLDIDTAIPLGLIVNELVTNALKYAFADGNDNVLNISIKKQDSSNYLLTIADNGKGLPDGFDILRTKSLGLRLVKRLAKQLQGTFSYNHEKGSIFVISFKDTNQRKEID